MHPLGIDEGRDAPPTVVWGTSLGVLTVMQKQTCRAVLRHSGKKRNEDILAYTWSQQTVYRYVQYQWVCSMLWDVLVSEPDPPRARGSGSETRDVRTRVHVHYLNDDVIALARWL